MRIPKKLIKHFPLLVLEYDKNKNILDVSKVNCGSMEKFWWICPCGHSYECSANKRTSRKQGCPYCSGRRVSEKNSITSVFPHLLDEYDKEKNILPPDKISYGSTTKVWWKCLKCFSSYDATPNSRTNPASPSGCPYCRGLRVNETNSLTNLRPDIAKQWDWLKNEKTPDDYTISSGKKAWFLCSVCEYSWSSVIAKRTNSNDPRGCPNCPSHFSSGHKEVFEFVKNIYEGEILVNTKEIIRNPNTNRKLELDIYFPKLQKAIEYNGVYWHSSERMKKMDKIKEKVCLENNIKLFVVKETSWLERRSVLEREIEFFLDEDKKYYD